MVDYWRKQCPQAGVTFCYCHGCKLVGDRTPKSRLLRSCVTESKFADDAALYASSREGFETVASSFVAVARLWGLTVSLVKSKGMVVGTGAALRYSLLSPILVGDGFIDVVEDLEDLVVVEDFQYLGSYISSDGELDVEVSGCLAKAAKMFGCLCSFIFVNGSLSIAIKRCVYTAIVVSTSLYGAETWAIKAPQMRRLQSFHNHCIRCILGVSRRLQWRDHITTEQLALEFSMTEGMDVLLALRRLRWLGHMGI